MPWLLRPISIADRGARRRGDERSDIPLPHKRVYDPARGVTEMEDVPETPLAPDLPKYLREPLEQQSPERLEVAASYATDLGRVEARTAEYRTGTATS